MKKYKLIVSDYKKNLLGHCVSKRFIDGFKAVRAAVPCKLVYSQKQGCWIGYKNLLEYTVIEIF